MCVSQRPWTGCRGPVCPAPPLLLLLLFLLSPLAQGAITIPAGLSQPPKMMEMPSSHTAFFPEDIALFCEATGNPTPTFRWLKDGETFGPQLEGSGTLKASEGETLDVYNGEFQCYASNAHGTAMTKTVQVIVETQPVLLKQHKIRKEAYEGDSIVLSCSPPKSSVPPHIHWMDKKLYHIKQSDRVLVGLDGNLYFANLLRSDTRDDYICNAQYPAARTILPETSVSLTVRHNNDVPHEKKPHLFTPKGSHSSVLALREHSVTLECIPKGLPTPKVEWKKKDGSLDRTGAQLDNHNRWLRFDRITEEVDGEYECRASNSHGSASHSFTVSVEAEPYWVKTPQNLIYAPGETVRLECLAEGIPTPTVTWRINGEPITGVDDEPRRSVSGGVLILKDVVYSDTAVYQCEASNKHGSILLNTFLHVVELEPQILSSDGVRYRVTEGGDVLLHCETFGSPKPRITWLDEVERPLLSHPRVSLLTNGTIRLSKSGHEDSGSYTCSVDNTNISITAHLDVFNQTVILTSPEDVRVLRGTDALLHCGFFVDPQLDKFKIEWKKNGHELLEPSPNKYTIFKNGTLKVMNVQSGDNAQFTCEVSTDLDNAKATGAITVVARPDPPKDLTLSDIEDHSLTLSWIPGSAHNSPIMEFVVEVQEEQHSEQAKWKWEVLETVPGDFNHRQLKLHPYGTYRFRVIAVNELGDSEPSLPSEHRSTPPAAPSGNPENVRSESTDPKTLTITWDEMQKRFHNGQDFQYKVSWRKSDGSSVHWEHAYVLGPPFQVNDTGTYTPFEIKVQAVNSLGAGPEPEPEIGHSGEDKPEEAPTGVSIMVMNSTVRVKWNEAQNVRGKLKGYKIYIQRLGPQGGRVRRSLGNPHHEEEREERSERARERHHDTREVMVQGAKTWEEVTGLQLFSRYELSMTAVNSKGEGPRSKPQLFVTPEGAPGPPASLRFESPTEKSLILYWTPPVHTNGILKDYVVLYQQESKDSPLKMEMISDASVTHIELENLDPSSHYIFKVIARTAAGEGPPITRRGATLLEGVPPSNVTITPENTSLNLSWVPGERHRNHGFTFRYARKCPGCDWEESEVVNSSQGFYSLKGLKPGSNYKLEIKLGNDTLWEDQTLTLGPEPSEMPGGFATQGWLIGLISAIILLVLILLILCLIKRRKGGKYAVKDKEDKEVDSEARPMKDETFGEYRSLESDADEKRSDSQPSLCGESKLGSDDSLAEYGDSVDIQFNEDGSFIGQYSGRGPVPHGNESSGPASPVNAVPPPPIAPSMSSILNRPS
ncbi:neural cell adhesion molecule L1.1-like [Halichoeres trimaculatus]|uniref:neural cell adhesion molecule L1.1-like n=1 Tax=Halichoeres trimaculatus TaxID=147232 RepID=UPI003D9EBA28